ncbi:acyl-CoA dehydrogenase family protein [Amycolatopsis anabasis]|uniref:acyl-CoA dehydrogenase family protein n=1 Tax=Amycolatopsis anabasis TaxID=1840409 RepID=UPI00131DE77B|nr:acyl-CoA dehydrogenase family protein [Amycolatopsis anabasis]
MDFTLDEHQRDLAELASGVLHNEVDHERANTAPGYDERAWQALAKTGLLALALPAELGGDGLGIAEVAVVLTEAGRCAAPVPALATLALGVLPVNHLGSPDQRAELLPEVAAGESLLTAAVHEPSTPFPARPRTRAVASGGAWRLTGTKTAVPYAAAATRILVPASLPGGTGIFLVDPAADGVTLTPSRGSAGAPEATVGLEGVAVAEQDLLAERAPGESIAVLHRYALAGAAALGDGVLAGALKLTTEHVGSRKQFGKPLATFQAVAQEIAEVYIAARTVRLAALSAAWRLSAGLDADADLDIAAYWLAEEAPRALATCHHLHGGLGVDITYPLHRYYALTKDLARFLGGAAHRLGKLGERVG